MKYIKATCEMSRNWTTGIEATMWYIYKCEAAVAIPIATNDICTIKRLSTIDTGQLESKTFVGYNIEEISEAEAFLACI